MSEASVKFPAKGYLRLWQIIGDEQAKPPIPPIFPVAKSTWWKGVKEGRYPKAYKLSERVTAWKCEDVLALLDRAA